MFFVFCAAILEANEAKNYVLYEAIAKSHEVSPTVIYPPSGGEQIPEKSFLGTFSLGEKIREFQLEKNFLDNLYTHIKSNDSSDEPFYAKGKNYVVETPHEKFYLIYYETAGLIRKDLIGIRFRIDLLLKIGEKENLFVNSSKSGNSCYDETILKILREASSK